MFCVQRSLFCGVPFGGSVTEVKSYLKDLELEYLNFTRLAQKAKSASASTSVLSEGNRSRRGEWFGRVKSL